MMLRFCTTLIAFSMLSTMASAEDAAPDWGKASEGFVVALKFDKETYTTTSDINVTISCSRLTDDWRIITNALSPGTCGGILEIRDEKGKPVPLQMSLDLGNGQSRQCRAGGSYTPEQLNIEKEAVTTSEFPINYDCVNTGETSGFFIPRPGTYTATAIWDAWSIEPKVETQVRSKPVVFHIVKE